MGSRATSKAPTSIWSDQNLGSMHPRPTKSGLVPTARDSRHFLQLASSKLLEAPVPPWHPFPHPSHPGMLEAPVPRRHSFLHPSHPGMLEAPVPKRHNFLHPSSSGMLEASSGSGTDARYAWSSLPSSPMSRDRPKQFKSEDTRTGTERTLKGSIGNIWGVSHHIIRPSTR